MRSPEQDLFLKEIGLNVRRIRLENSITMESLAFDSGIDFRQIGRIERGEINTTILSLFRIAETLHSDISCFFE